MGDLTLEEKTSGAVMRAREEEAEKHFFDLNQPFFPFGFSVGYRNPGHWDVFSKRCPGRVSAWIAAHPGGSTSDNDNTRERAFRIRGEPGAVVVYDHRWNPHRSHKDSPPTFRSVLAAMLWICEELMQEPTNV